MRLTLLDFEQEAKAVLPPEHYDYFAGAAGEESTLRANLTALQAVRLRPRILRGNAHRDLGVTLFGTSLRMPVLIAPTAFHRLAHPEGELATARAAAAAGTVMIVSTASTTRLQDLAGTGAHLWFQIYLQPDLALTSGLVRLAERTGCEALVVTVDSPVRARRERDDRNGFHDLPDGLRSENLVREDGTVPDIVFDASPTWERIDRLRAGTSLPILLKGVLHPDDARVAVEHGVDGLIVSNHGGRQLDGVLASIEALPEVAAAVPEGFPLIMDGGVRRGIDVVRALALGATAVGLGRPVIWGLAAAGQKGVTEVLDLLCEEYDLALASCGGASGADLDASILAPRNGSHGKEKGY